MDGINAIATHSVVEVRSQSECFQGQVNGFRQHVGEPTEPRDEYRDGPWARHEPGTFYFWLQTSEHTEKLLGPFWWNDEQQVFEGPTRRVSKNASCGEYEAVPVPAHEQQTLRVLQREPYHDPA